MFHFTQKYRTDNKAKTHPNFILTACLASRNLLAENEILHNVGETEIH